MSDRVGSGWDQVEDGDIIAAYSDALAEVERLTEQLRLANIDALNAQTELAHHEGGRP